MKKIPSNAFDFYVSLGPRRSYEAVAARYRVSKRAVTRCAAREGWQGRLADLEALDGAREDPGETRKTLEALRELQRKAVAAIESLTFRSAGEALDAIEAALRLEHLILSTPTCGPRIKRHTRPVGG